MDLADEIQDYVMTAYRQWQLEREQVCRAVAEDCQRWLDDLLENPEGRHPRQEWSDFAARWSDQVAIDPNSYRDFEEWLVEHLERGFCCDHDEHEPVEGDSEHESDQQFLFGDLATEATPSLVASTVAGLQWAESFEVEDEEAELVRLSEYSGRLAREAEYAGRPLEMQQFDALRVELLREAGYIVPEEPSSLSLAVDGATSLLGGALLKAGGTVLGRTLQKFLPRLTARAAKVKENVSAAKSVLRKKILTPIAKSRIGRAAIRARSANSALLTAGEQRVAQYGRRWQKAGVEKAIVRHAGPNATSWRTASGKTIFENPATGRQVIVDDAGYFRIFQPKTIGSQRGQYLDMLGKVPSPARHVKGGAIKNVPLSGDDLNAATHFLIE